VRLAVIDLLGARLRDSRWLDLCCGSGAMACEALQRGAREVVAVEQDRRVAAVARANLTAVARGRPGCAASVHCAEVTRWLARRGDTGFDLIYADPPWSGGLYPALAEGVVAGNWLRPGGTMVWECPREHPPGVPQGWLLLDRRRYGGTELLLLRQAPERDSAAQGGPAAVLVPGGDEQTDQGDRDQTEHDAAEQGFDHGDAGRTWP
jgi:16S rRNA (guanine(966)-N(2))-methyltransferase RsmD